MTVIAIVYNIQTKYKINEYIEYVVYLFQESWWKLRPNSSISVTYNCFFFTNYSQIITEQMTFKIVIWLKYNFYVNFKNKSSQFQTGKYYGDKMKTYWQYK